MLLKEIIVKSLISAPAFYFFQFCFPYCFELFGNSYLQSFGFLYNPRNICNLASFWKETVYMGWLAISTSLPLLLWHLSISFARWHLPANTDPDLPGCCTVPPASFDYYFSYNMIFLFSASFPLYLPASLPYATLLLLRVCHFQVSVGLIIAWKSSPPLRLSWCLLPKGILRQKAGNLWQVMERWPSIPTGLGANSIAKVFP